jgi:gas vesicle protein
MRRILFGAIVGAIAMYFLDPGHGEERRNMLTGRWSERNETVLEAARTTAAAVTSASQTAPSAAERLDQIEPSKGKPSNGGRVRSGSPGQAGGKG